MEAENFGSSYSTEGITATSPMLPPDMAVQVVSASKDSITFIADEFVSEVHFRNMTDNALLIHRHPTFRPFTPDFDLTTSYNSMMIA